MTNREIAALLATSELDADLVEAFLDRFDATRPETAADMLADE